MLAPHLLVVVHLFTHEILRQTLALLLTDYRRGPYGSHMSTGIVCIGRSMLSKTDQMTSALDKKNCGNIYMYISSIGN